MKQLRNILTGVLLACGLSLPAVSMQADSNPAAQNEQEENTVDVKEIVFGHIGDSYEWHITDFGETKVIIPLPVIVYSGTTGWHVFLSSRLEENGGCYEGLSIAPEGSKYEGKLVEHDHQQCIIDSHRTERCPLVSQASSGQCGSGRFRRVYGDVHYDGE